MSESPFCRLLTARSKAIMLLEHAESRFKHGPWRLKNQLSLAASIELDTPVAPYVGRFARSLVKFW
jgi:hypothetical protein